MQNIYKFMLLVMLGETCNIPNFGTKKNLVLPDPKFRTNENFLKSFTDDCVFLPIAMFELV